MPILQDFEYYKPKTVSQALKLLSSVKKASILAGGTDIIAEIKEEMVSPAALIDIKGIKELRKIEYKKSKLTIGSLVTFSDIIDSKIIKSKFPVIIEVARTVGSVGIRNRATLAGNICSAVPCMDSGPVLTAYEAEISVSGIRGKRKIAINEFFKGPRKTALKKGEVVTAVSISLPAKKHAGCYVKLGRYSGEDLAQASVLILSLPDNQYRVAFGSVGPTPTRARGIEKILNGNWPDNGLIDKAKRMIENTVFPITDIRATKEYRMHMCQVMFERCIKAAAARLKGDGPEYGASLI